MYGITCSRIYRQLLHRFLVPIFLTLSIAAITESEYLRLPGEQTIHNLNATIGVILPASKIASDCWYDLTYTITTHTFFQSPFRYLPISFQFFSIQGKLEWELTTMPSPTSYDWEPNHSYRITIPFKLPPHLLPGNYTVMVGLLSKDNTDVYCFSNTLPGQVRVNAGTIEVTGESLFHENSRLNYILCTGCFDEEPDPERNENFQWLAQNSEFEFPHTFSDCWLYIDCSCPLPKFNTVSIRVNGILIDKVRISSLPFRSKYLLKKEFLHRFKDKVRISFFSEYSYNPSEKGGSSDIRDLALRLYHLDLVQH